VRNLPAPLQDSVEDALIRLGLGRKIREASPVTGGCINHGARLDTDGGSYFLKWNPSAPPQLFEAEADGLRALGASGALRVPQPLAHGGGSGAPPWLLMEYVEGGAPNRTYEESLGRGLATLHTSRVTSGDFGWPRNNWIGSLPQSNAASASWAAFWRDQRLTPQLERAREGGFLRGPSGRVLDRVLDVVPLVLSDVDRSTPHLLHGDLWGGNAFPARDGTPTLIDPAVYRGHGEVDLAMTELFGGFGTRFYDAYREVGGAGEAYQAYRRDLYQLYYLLVHVNHFGSSYERPTLASASRIASAVAG
jgi:fructosamine-3-kinase